METTKIGDGRKEIRPGSIVALNWAVKRYDEVGGLSTSGIKLGVVTKITRRSKNNTRKKNKETTITVFIPDLINKSYEYTLEEVEISSCRAIEVLNFDFFDKCNNTRYKDVVRGLRELDKAEEK